MVEEDDDDNAVREDEVDGDIGVKAKYRSGTFCTHRHISRIICTHKVITPASPCTAWQCHMPLRSVFKLYVAQCLYPSVPFLPGEWKRLSILLLHSNRSAQTFVSTRACLTLIILEVRLLACLSMQRQQTHALSYNTSLPVYHHSELVCAPVNAAPFLFLRRSKSWDISRIRHFKGKLKPAASRFNTCTHPHNFTFHSLK